MVISTREGMEKDKLKYHKRFAALMLDNIEEEYYKRFAALITSKRNENYHYGITYIRRKLLFSILRTTLITVRGTRRNPVGRTLR